MLAMGSRHRARRKSSRREARPAGAQRLAAATRSELREEPREGADLEALLPAGVSRELALQLLSVAGLTIEEALELYERGELEDRVRGLAPDDIAALTAILQGAGVEAPVPTAQPADQLREDEDASASRRDAALVRPMPQVQRTFPRPTRSLIVADAARRLAAGQMRRSAFLARLETVVRSTAEATLAGSGRSARDCPYIERSLRYYQDKDSRHIERAIRRYAPAAAEARSSRGYLDAVQHRVESAVTRWLRTGEVTGVPRGVPSPLAASLAGIAAARPMPPVLHKGDGGAADDVPPQAIRARLGSGHALDGSVRTRMERAFGSSFSSVRVHTDARAATLSSQVGAHAFAVGDDVAFAGGRYVPGTPMGDALIAHELAHVLQQRGAGRTNGTLAAGTSPNLERDADYSAAAVLTSLWKNGRGGAAEVAHQALPRLRSGLRLSRCKDDEKTAPPTPQPTPAPTPQPTPAPTPQAPACKPTVKSFEAKKTAGAGEMVKDDRSGTCVLQFSKGGRTAGMHFEVEVDVPAGCTGTLELLQHVDTCNEQRDDDNHTWVNSSCKGLDTQDPYKSWRVSKAGTFKARDEDSPSVAPFLGRDMVNVKKAEFAMYLLWTPDSPAGSPRVGLAVANWQWKASATKTGRTGACSEQWRVSGVDSTGGVGTPITNAPAAPKVVCPGGATVTAGQC